MPQNRHSVPAAQYVRMSTDHQQYSTANQNDVIREYATKRGFEIVRTYADEGRSGLSVSGRAALQQLIADVQSGEPGFAAILVYDISRWGRFQDADESAYYEYLCKRAGISVHYCAEQFENDGGPASTIIKSVKRSMAAEYSRELSTKVFQGQCRLIELGFRQGGAPGFGYRRLLVDMAGNPKVILQRGEMKSLQTDRVVLVLGPEQEVATVQRMYVLFADTRKSELEIAAQMNSEGIVTDLGRPWTRETVRQVLTNEKYLGHNVYNRTSFKLKRVHVRNTSEMWVRRDHAFPGIISAEIFGRVQAILAERTRKVPTGEMLDRLRELAERHHPLSAKLIDSTENMPSSAAYSTRFGSLLRAYQLIGYVPARDYAFVEINRRLRTVHRPLLERLTELLQKSGATVAPATRSGTLLINGEFSAALVLSRCQKTVAGSLRWHVQFTQSQTPDITILARMDDANEHPADFYFLPAIDMTAPHVALAEVNNVLLDTYQFEGLDFFSRLTARYRVEVAA